MYLNVKCNDLYPAFNRNIHFSNIINVFTDINACLLTKIMNFNLYIFNPKLLNSSVSWFLQKY